MKKRRQQRILEIITDKKIEKQEELVEILAAEGYNITQATVSRDIKELRIVKALGEDGGYYYATGSTASPSLKRSYNILTDSIKSVDNAINIVVVKCISGRAAAVCATIDDMERSKIVGTIAGDDTIFIVLKTEEEAYVLKKEIINLIER
ncbi:MAG: arginine repressor [Clostridia bacterium]|nr:arginine repressor [Clostridia bacterium]MBR2327997.1 arginine repressor [Clostridia bacterium]